MIVGEVDWNSADSSSGKSDIMKLEEGENTVRIMSNPIQFYVNWCNGPDGSKRKFNSPIDDPAMLRRLEDSGFKRSARWFVKVLDRRDNKFKALDIGPQVFNGIKSLYSNKRWGKVTGYDITITRAPKGTQPLYSVTPNPHEPIPGDLKAQFQEFNDRMNLEKLISPSSSSDIMEYMRWTDVKSSSSSFSASTSSSKQTQKASGDEFDFEFDS
jgi:hypothetical protein